MTKVTQLRNRISERIARLERLRTELECSDDMLFTRGSKNYVQWQEWGAELSLLRKQLEQIKQS